VKLLASTVLRDSRFRRGSLFRIRLIRLWALARLECLQLLRDRTSIALIVTVPAIQLILFGYAVNLNPKNIPVAIARNHDGSVDQLHRTIVET
jgi:ABC-2 type transport system permease protein